MAVIKIACPKCGQKVSGDETFYGRSVNCPICTSKIIFPLNPTGPNLDSLSSTGGAAQSVPTPNRPAPAQPGTPSFETVYPSSQPFPTPPSFDTVVPSGQPVRQPSGFQETPQPSPGPSLPQVPRAPESPRVDQNAVPSPLLGAVSLVVGILNTVTSCVGGILLAPIAIILGHAALARAKHSPVQPAPGQSLAMIGVILGYAGLVFTIIGLIALLVFKEPIMEFLNHRASAGA